MKKQDLAVFASICMLGSMPAFVLAEDAGRPEETGYTARPMEEPITGTVEDFGVTEQDIVVLYNNDVHGGISNDSDYSGSGSSLGYAGMAAVKADLRKAAHAVTTVDLGDAIQGSVVTTETDGRCVMDLMDEIGYEIRIPGNHEFDYGMEAFLSYAEKAGTFLSANFIDTTTGEPVFDGYKVLSYDLNGTEFRIGYVGMTTPESLTQSTPAYFQDEEGNFIYGFSAETAQDLYDHIQQAIDDAYTDGADIVIGLGHMGDHGVDNGWSSVDVIRHTKGLSAFLDGHAHTVMPGTIVENVDGEPVLLSSTGTKLENIGVLKISVEGDEVSLQSGLINDLTRDEYTSYAYTQVDEMVQAIEEEYAYLFVKVGSTDHDLVIYDPESGDRLVRTAETNLGDLLSDAYREMLQTDIAVMNGGSIRADLKAGDINYMGVVSVFPWNTPVSVVEVPGQVILDMLEMGARLYPEECGGFIQPSGLVYTIDATIPSSVSVNTDGGFVSVDGEYRVRDVLVNGEPLDTDKLYTLAINTYYSREYGDGMNMFKGCKILVPAEGEEDIIDHDVIIDYLAAHEDKVPEGYEDPYGQGRITIIEETADEPMDDAA